MMTLAGIKQPAIYLRYYNHLWNLYSYFDENGVIIQCPHISQGLKVDICWPFEFTKREKSVSRNSFDNRVFDASYTNYA